MPIVEISIPLSCSPYRSIALSPASHSRLVGANSPLVAVSSNHTRLLGASPLRCSRSQHANHTRHSRIHRLIAGHLFLDGLAVNHARLHVVGGWRQRSGGGNLRRGCNRVADAAEQTAERRPRASARGRSGISRRASGVGAASSALKWEQGSGVRVCYVR